jgi:hypothetical protein
MKFNFKSCSEEELWKFVGSHLSKNNFDAVLVGGAVVSIYSEGAYQSGDLDFIIQNLIKDRLPDVMKQIGFIKSGRYYKHPECNHLFVEFPTGPLEIGDDHTIKPNIQKKDGIEIKILTPTDCIKDRLASYIYFKSQEGLDQAVLVARSQSFNKTAVKRWCEGEDADFAFKDFIEKLRK